MRGRDSHLLSRLFPLGEHARIEVSAFGGDGAHNKPNLRINSEIRRGFQLKIAGIKITKKGLFSKGAYNRIKGLQFGKDELGLGKKISFLNFEKTTLF